jgi:HAD superfamily hydrolase (TIGR01509 family)
MDGLMLDTEPLAARAYLDAAAAVGLAFDSAVTPSLVGRTYGDCRTLILAHHGDSYPVDLLMTQWHAAYDAIVDREGVATKPGLLELLDWLEAHTIPKAVATSTRNARACVKLARTQLLARFVTVVGGDQVAHGKPAPDIFLAAAVALGVDPADCLVLEDSPAGLEAAARAGMAAIVIPDLCAAPADVLGKAPLVMQSLHDVRAHLAALPA